MSVASRKRARAMWLLAGFGGAAAAGGGGPTYDTDAQAYITLVEAADNQSLETGVKDAINAFVVGCKSDGIWDAMTDVGLFAPSRTLTGVVVPLKGSTPTNSNFVSGDYTRATGLAGDAATKYIAINKDDGDYPQDDFHQAVYTTTAGTAGDLFGVSANNGYADSLMRDYSAFFRGRVNNTNYTHSQAAGQSGFIGFSRASSASYSARYGGVTDSIAHASIGPEPGQVRVVFAVSGTQPTIGSVSNFSDAVISFYSIGEALDLALLDSRVSTLMTAIGAAIP